LEQLISSLVFCFFFVGARVQGLVEVSWICAFYSTLEGCQEVKVCPTKDLLRNFDSKATERLEIGREVCSWAAFVLLF